MGKPYVGEIANLYETYEWAKGFDISIKKAVLRPHPTHWWPLDREGHLPLRILWQILIVGMPDAFLRLYSSGRIIRRDGFTLICLVT